MRKRLSISRMVSGLLLALLAAAGLWTHRMDRGILSAARRHHIDPLFLRAVAITESRMDPKAVGAAGEIGMFQIMPNTAKHWAQETGQNIPTEKELFRVSLNAGISAWYLRQGLEEFAHKNDPLVYALAYYNAGPSRARAWEKKEVEGVPFVQSIPFESTRAYVTKILEIYRGESEEKLFRSMKGRNRD